MRGQPEWPRSQISAPWSLNRYCTHQGSIKLLHSYEKLPGSWNSAKSSEDPRQIPNPASLFCWPVFVIHLMLSLSGQLLLLPAGTGDHTRQDTVPMNAKEETPSRMGHGSCLGPSDSQTSAHRQRKESAMVVQRPPHMSASGYSPSLRVINTSHSPRPDSTSVSCMQSLSQALSCDLHRNYVKRCSHCLCVHCCFAW